MECSCITGLKTKNKCSVVNQNSHKTIKSTEKILYQLGITLRTFALAPTSMNNKRATSSPVSSLKIEKKFCRPNFYAAGPKSFAFAIPSDLFLLVCKLDKSLLLLKVCII